MIIEVCQREMDYWTDAAGQRRPKYHAQVEGKPGYWACGRSVDEAVGNLVNTHAALFDLTVRDLGKQCR